MQMPWIVTSVISGVVATSAAALGVNALRFEKRVEREVQAFWTAPQPDEPSELTRLEQLPEQVRCYLNRAIPRDHGPLTTARIKHGGTFRPNLDGAWYPVRGSQFFRMDPPAFVWWGRIRIAPGVWIDARDRYHYGRGNMLVKLDSTFLVANSSGPEIDQGSLLRLLAEMVWFPTAFLNPSITWTSLDDRHVQARILVDDHDVSGVFEFGSDDMPTGFRAMRYRDTGNGKAELTEFYGSMSDYRRVDGFLVPHRLVAHWKVGDELVPYARFSVENIQYDRPLSAKSR